MNTDPSYDEISDHARGIWQSRGQPAGQDTEIWLDAERELRARAGGIPPLPDDATRTDAALASGQNQRKGSSGRADSKAQGGAN